MCEDVLHLGALVGVLVGGEPHKAVVVEVESERVDGGDQKVEAQVELSFVDQVWPCHISLYYERSGCGYLAPLVDNFDSFSPRQGRGLHYPPPLAPLPLPHLPQQLRVGGQTEGPR